MCSNRSRLRSLPVLAHQRETVAPCDEAWPCAKISRSFWCLWRVLLTSTSDRGELSRPSGPEWAEGSRCHTHTLMTRWSILAGVLGQDFSTKPNRRMKHVRPGALIFRSFETWRQKQARTTQQGGNPWLLRLRFFETVLVPMKWHRFLSCFTPLPLHICPYCSVSLYEMRKNLNSKWHNYYYYYSSCSQRCWRGLWKGSMGELNCSYQ